MNYWSGEIPDDWFQQIRKTSVKNYLSKGDFRPCKHFPCALDNGIGVCEREKKPLVYKVRCANIAVRR